MVRKSFTNRERDNMLDKLQKMFKNILDEKD